MSNEVIIRFEEVSFNFGYNKPILDEVSFTVREGLKVTFMGQNGAGKSTIFKMITGELQPEDGEIHISPKATVAIARQVIPRDQLDLTVRDFFQKCFKDKVYDIDPRIDEVLNIVNLEAKKDRIIGSFSGGQQARLLLASALIQKPDILLLDEPTNNLDKDGIAHLRNFILNYPKTCLVISHDAEFLNAFTQAVLYLDVRTKKIEQYQGNYHNVVAQISARIEKENRENARLAKEAIANKEKANFFAMKGGKLRLVAKRMRDKAEELEESAVDVRQEDKTIRNFIIPTQEDIIGEIISIKECQIIKNHKPKKIKTDISLKKDSHLLLAGPNGIGKSTLLESIANKTADGIKIGDGVVVGYYRQDFSTLNFEDTVYETLLGASSRKEEEYLRSVAAGFLIGPDIFKSKIVNLSEGQKGLVSLAQLVLIRPGLLILDEPTNHMNFRHLPVIAKALSDFKGAMILVSHVPEFIEQIRIDQTLNLGDHL